MNKKENMILSIPVIVAVLVIFILYKATADNILLNNFDIIINNYINFVSVLVGFLITTITIIIGFFDKRIIKEIIKTNKQKVLFANWFLTIITGICSILYSFYIVAVFNSDINTISKGIFLIIIFFTLLFMGYLICSLIYFFGITSFIMKENVEEEIIGDIAKDNIRLPKDIK